MISDNYSTFKQKKLIVNLKKIFTQVKHSTDVFSIKTKTYKKINFQNIIVKFQVVTKKWKKQFYSLFNDNPSTIDSNNLSHTRRMHKHII